VKLDSFGLASLTIASTNAVLSTPSLDTAHRLLASPHDCISGTRSLASWSSRATPAFVLGLMRGEMRRVSCFGSMLSCAQAAGGEGTGQSDTGASPSTTGATPQQHLRGRHMGRRGERREEHHHRHHPRRVPCLPLP
jgi:hypothetical protein